MKFDFFQNTDTTEPATRQNDASAPTEQEHIREQESTNIVTSPNEASDIGSRKKQKAFSLLQPNYAK